MAVSKRDVVLLYHSIDSDLDGYRYGLTGADFEAHLDYLRSHVQVAPLSDIVDGQAGRRMRVAITFDDGYENFYTEAFPRLASRRLPATVFLATSFIETQNVMNPVRPNMTWSQIREMHQSGRVLRLALA